MTDEERGAIMEALKGLPESDKQFMLGYAAGRAASAPKGTDQPEDEKKAG